MSYMVSIVTISGNSFLNIWKYYHSVILLLSNYSNDYGKLEYLISLLFWHTSCSYN